MKKSLILGLLALTLGFSANTLRAGDCIVGYWFGSPKIEKQTDAYGLRLGLPGSSGGPVNLSGMEFSIFCSSTEWLDGFQLTLCGPALAGNVRGLQISLYNRVRKNIDGVQIGVVNGSDEEADLQFGVVNYARSNAAFQLGLVNINPKGFLPVSIIVNFGNIGDAN